MAINDVRAAKEPPSSGRELSSATAEFCESITARTATVPPPLSALTQSRLLMVLELPAN